MESTGLPEKIQVSDQYKVGLDNYYPEFETSIRGEVEIKGKGIMVTYWLEGKRRQDTDTQKTNSTVQMNELGI